MKQPKSSTHSKKKPSDILQEDLMKKELELNFIKEVYENKASINKVLTKSNLEDLNILPKKTQKKPATPKDLLEKIEREKLRREEKEKLRMLEKLEAQVLGKKAKKLNALPNSATTSITSINKQNTQNNLGASRHKENDNSWKINKKLLDDQEFRRTIKKEKIEIDCVNPLINFGTKNNQLDDTKLEKEFLDSLSKEKMKFFMFRTREVYDFLESIKLLRMIETFIEDGIEDMECILEIDEDYYEEKQFPKEIEQRIKNKIIEIKKKKGIHIEGNIKNLNQTDKQDHNYQIEKKIEKISSKQSNQDVDDNYDEEEQARLFRQAVEEFRNAGKKSENSSDIPTQEELGTNPDPNSKLLPANKERKCCWNCLKVILSETAIEQYFEEKIMKYKVDFCSEICSNEYKSKIYSFCDLCKKRIEKGVGKFFDNKWFCEADCLEEYIRENSDKLMNEYQDEAENEGESKNEGNSEQEASEGNDESEKEDLTDENDAYDPMQDF